MPICKILVIRSHWGVRIDLLALGSTSDFVNFLLSPPFLVNQCSGQKEEFLLYGAILCDMVWNLRNQVLFGGGSLNVDGVSTKISSLFFEHNIPKGSTTYQLVPSSIQTWIPPPGMSFKINVDTAVGPRFSSIVVVARDRRVELVFAGSMKVNTTLPLLAKAEAIKWALSFVPAMGNDCIIVESDCHYCVSLLNDLAEPSPPPPWRFWSLCSELRLSLSVLDKVL